MKSLKYFRIIFILLLPIFFYNCSSAPNLVDSSQTQFSAPSSTLFSTHTLAPSQTIEPSQTPTISPTPDFLCAYAKDLADLFGPYADSNNEIVHLIGDAQDSPSLLAEDLWLSRVDKHFEEIRDAIQTMDVLEVPEHFIKTEEILSAFFFHTEQLIEHSNSYIEREVVPNDWSDVRTDLDNIYNTIKELQSIMKYLTDDLACSYVWGKRLD